MQVPTHSLAKACIQSMSTEKKAQVHLSQFHELTEFVSSPPELGSEGIFVSARNIPLENFRQQSTAVVGEGQDRIDMHIPQAASGNPSNLIGEPLSEKSTCSLHLDNAVMILRNLTLSSNASATMLSMKYFQSLMYRKVQEVLLAVQAKASASFQSSE